MSLLRQFSDDLSRLIAGVLPSVVALSDPDSRSAGSGFLIDSVGHVVTNYHVVADSDKTIRASLPGLPDQDAVILGLDQYTDLAVLQLENPPKDFVRFRDEPARLGELCFAVGSPLGYLTESVSIGIVSGLARTINHQMTTRPIERCIQVDAAINPGNSGGPVFDADGLVIGVATAGRNEADNIGFAVTAATARTVVPELIVHGRVVRASLGIGIAPRVIELDGHQVPRQAVVKVSARAAAAGFVMGDVILSIQGQAADERADLYDHLGRESIGRPVALELLRAGEVVQLTITPEAPV
ncbi:trypsin-like peptidase domain-containing protein [Actinocorallia lasiicapitis]